MLFDARRASNWGGGASSEHACNLATEIQYCIHKLKKKNGYYRVKAPLLDT